MTTEKLKATDTVSSGLICNPKAGEAAQATGLFEIKCHDKDGNLKWEAQSKNLVVNVGLAYMAGTALTSVAQITTGTLVCTVLGPVTPRRRQIRCLPTLVGQRL